MKADGNILLSVYPVARPVAEALERSCGVVFDNQRCLADLKRSSPFKVLGALRQIRPTTLWVLSGDTRQNPYASLLLLLSVLTRARTLRALSFDGSSVALARSTTALRQSGQLALGTLRGFVYLLRAERELRALGRGQRGGFTLAGSRPRISYLKTNLWFGVQAGGSVGHVAGVVNSLHRRGYPITVYSIEKLPTLDRDVPVAEVAVGATNGLPLEIGAYTFDRRFTRRALAALHPPPELLYQRNCLANYSGVKLSRRLCVPLIVEYNGSEVWVARHWGSPLRFHKAAQRCEDAMLRHAHVIVVVSEVLRQELLGRGVEDERIVCYPNCVDPATYDPDRFSQAERLAARATFDIPPDAITALFLGTFGPWHGVELLAQTIRQLARTRRAWLEETRTVFLLLGDGQLMPRVREILGEVPPELYRLAGLVPQAEAPRHLAAADLLLSPHVPNPDGTRFFGSPTKLFEYMAMGKAIIASDLEQIGEVLAPSHHIGRDGLPRREEDLAASCALLTTPGSAPDLVSALEYLVPRPELRARLGAAARARVLERYTWDRHVDAILDRVQRLCAGPD
jgi:glycosyltransferase involved in cell wall biosynthesis